MFTLHCVCVCWMMQRMLHINVIKSRRQTFLYKIKYGSNLNSHFILQIVCMFRCSADCLRSYRESKKFHSAQAKCPLQLIIFQSNNFVITTISIRSCLSDNFGVARGRDDRYGSNDFYSRHNAPLLPDKYINYSFEWLLIDEYIFFHFHFYRGILLHQSNESQFTELTILFCRCSHCH